LDCFLKEKLSKNFVAINLNIKIKLYLFVIKLWSVCEERI
jgi:hypothetical protein